MGVNPKGIRVGPSSGGRSAIKTADARAYQGYRSDVVLDVRAHPLVLHEFTAALTRVGFSPAGETQEGHQHRWVRDLASIDVLIPQGLGRAATVKRGVTGATTLSSPGAQQAIRRAEPVGVQVDQTEGTVHRPNLIGALVSKAAAYSVPGDPNKARHIIDFAALAAMARRSDRIAQQLSAGDRKHLAPMLTALAASRPLWSSTPGAERGVLALTRLAGQEIK